MRTKKCNSCKQVKAYDEFHRRRTRHNTIIPVTLCKACQKIYDRKRHKLYYQQTKHRYKAGEPRIIAKIKVREALRKGTLKKQKYKVCNSSHTEAHHRDYTKPYVITWLCRKHHRRWHSKVKRK